MIPVRCFSCGKVISNYWDEYKRRVNDGEDSAAVMDDLGITRYCCRRMFLSHVELVDVLSPNQRDRRVAWSILRCSGRRNLSSNLSGPTSLFQGTGCQVYVLNIKFIMLLNYRNSSERF